MIGLEKSTSHCHKMCHNFLIYHNSYDCCTMMMEITFCWDDDDDDDEQRENFGGV